MNPAMWISKTGVQAQDAKLQTIANNLANVNTVGFKRDRAVFEDLFYQDGRQPGAQGDNGNVAPLGVQLGNGTRLVGTQKVFTTGSLQVTSQTLDVAIEGNGFLQVEGPEGRTAYTRSGQLQLDSDGHLVTAQGQRIQPEISIPANANNVTISPNGTITAKIGDAVNASELGQLRLANFINPPGLRALGDNLYEETAASGAPTEGVAGEQGLGKIRQGALEGSNVQVVEEMVDMISAQRTYEMNTKVLSAADGMLQTLAQAAR